MKKIAIDVDDTLSATSLKFHQVLSKLYGSVPGITPPAMAKHYALSGRVLHYGDNPAAFNYIHNLSNSPEFHLDLKPISGSVESLNLISQHIDCYWTARVDTESMRQVTELWLKKYYPIRPVVMRPSEYATNSSFLKAEIIISKPGYYSAVIDNDVRVVHALLELGYKGEIFVHGLTEEDHKKHFKKNTSQIIFCENWDLLGPALIDYFS
ncbi:MAG TPA: hypothetical protein VJC39_00440 [Candidatus Nanoarchaeia archaeon]|nr:hypothetical protein [Candidatus Nanoarchaeia archaeon]